MSRPRIELNADLQRDAVGPQERKPTSPLIWLLLLLVVLVLGAWWFMTRSAGTTPMVDTTTAAPVQTLPSDAPEISAKPARANPQHRTHTRKAPVIADRTARLMADTPKPRYPPAALRANVGGTVTLNVQVDPQGEPLEIRIAKRSGNRDLDRAALTAASQWRFEPAMHQGKAVAEAVQIPVEFSPQ